MNDTYDSSMYYTQSSDVAGATAAGILVTLIVLTLVVGLISYVVTAIFLGMMFKKAGIEQWKAWVPVYNVWTLLEMGEEPGWWSILMLVPIVNIVAMVFIYIAAYKIGLGFGKDRVFVLLAIFFPIVWLIWLAIDKSEWKPVNFTSVPVYDTEQPSTSNTPPTT